MGLAGLRNRVAKLESARRTASMMDMAPYLGAEGLLDFVPKITPTFMKPEHLRPVARLLERAAAGEPVRAVVMCPPRHAKTETTVIHGIPWYLAQFPDRHIAYVTYEAELARDKSASARDVAGRVGIQLREDSKSKRHWLTPSKGGMFATGIGGPLTGHGFQLGIVDDPFKNRKEAESKTARDSVHRWFTSTFMTRLEPSASVIVQHTRWHDDDLIGRLIKDKEVRWEVVRLPAILDEGKPNERALWEARWNLQALKTRKREVGPYDWASLYAQWPKPAGSRLFATPPARYTRAELAAVLKGGARLVIVCDPAATAKTSADWTAIVVLAVFGWGLEQRAYVLEVFRMQEEWPKPMAALERLQKRWGCAIGIEAVAGFKAVPQMFRAIRPNLPIFDIVDTRDKLTRALPAAAAWADGRLLLPAQAPWLDEFSNEVQAFTGVSDAQDDQVDGMALAFNVLDNASPPIQTGSQPTRIAFA